MSASDDIYLRVDGPVGWLVLNRPRKRNAITVAMWEALPALLAAAEANPAIKVVVVRGADETAFAAGAAPAAASDPSRMAIQRVSSLLSSAIFTVIVSGTDSNIPTAPKTHPQKTSERNTTSVDRPKPRPMKRGSITLPTVTLMTM